jgi:hypothetical protein
VGARNASGARADRDLRSLIRRDPAPAVRVSAIERLVELRAADHPDLSVRSLARIALGGEVGHTHE